MFIQVPCPACGGAGGQYVTHDMASDAQESAMEGYFLPCACNGGFIEVEADADGLPTTAPKGERTPLSPDEIPF